MFGWLCFWNFRKNKPVEKPAPRKGMSFDEFQASIATEKARLKRKRYDSDRVAPQTNTQVFVHQDAGLSDFEAAMILANAMDSAQDDYVAPPMEYQGGGGESGGGGASADYSDSSSSSSSDSSSSYDSGSSSCDSGSSYDSSSSSCGGDF